MDSEEIARTLGRIEASVLSIETWLKQYGLRMDKLEGRVNLLERLNTAQVSNVRLLAYCITSALACGGLIMAVLRYFKS